jgi:hypothetical protein
MNDNLSLMIFSIIKRRICLSDQFYKNSFGFNNENEEEEEEEELFVVIDGSFSIYSSSLYFICFTIFLFL